MNVHEEFLTSARARFAQQKHLATAAIEQLSEEDLLWQPDPLSNSAAIIIQHLHGNMLSRWTDFLTTDGEKPTRQRDDEFEMPEPPDKVRLLTLWEAGWACLFDALGALNEDALAKTVTIRGESLTVIDAIHRQLTHAAYHTGQIVWIAKARRGPDWKTLSIPRGQSQNQELIRSLGFGYRDNPERPA